MGCDSLVLKPCEVAYFGNPLRIFVYLFFKICVLPFLGSFSLPCPPYPPLSYTVHLRRYTTNQMNVLVYGKNHPRPEGTPKDAEK